MTLPIFLNMRARPGGAGVGGAGTPPVSEGLVDAFFAVTDGVADQDINSATFADLTSLSVTVTATAVGDTLLISCVLPHYSDGAGSAFHVRFLIDGAGARGANDVGYINSIGGSTTSQRLHWVHVVEAGDITGGNTIVKAQARKPGAGSEQVHLRNAAESVGTLTVVRVRT
jgi:hypothetical protein